MQTRWDRDVNFLDSMVNAHESVVPWKTSLVIQWLRICLSMQGMWVSVPCQGTRIPHLWGN